MKIYKSAERFRPVLKKYQTDLNLLMIVTVISCSVKDYLLEKILGLNDSPILVFNSGEQLYKKI